MILDSPDSRSVHRPAIADQDEVAAKLLMQLLEKERHVLSDDVAKMIVEVHADASSSGSQRQRSDHADAIVTLPRGMNGRLSARSPRSTYDGLQHEPGFVQEYKASLRTRSPSICEASRRPAIAQWLPRFVREHGVLAAVDSTPTNAESSTQDPGAEACQTAGS